MKYHHIATGGRAAGLVGWWIIALSLVKTGTSFSSYFVSVKQSELRRYTVEMYASAVIAVTHFIHIWPWPLTFDLWPWKPLQQCPLTWCIVVVSFIQILQVSKEISRYAKNANGRTTDGRAENIILSPPIVGAGGIIIIRRAYSR